MPLPYDYEQETKKLFGKRSCLTDVIDEATKESWMTMLDRDVNEQKIIIRDNPTRDRTSIIQSRNRLNDRLMVRAIVKSFLELPRCQPSEYDDAIQE